MKLDLHVHSKYSYDGILEPKHIAKIAKKKGLDGVAITDHNSIEGGVKAKEYETEDFKIIIGSEISTKKGEIIGLFLSEEITSSDPYEVVTQIKEQGGIVVIPHPFDELRSSAFHPTQDDVKFIDVVEVFNSRCIFDGYNRKADDFAANNALSMSGGSDAHFANEIGNAGIKTENMDIITALKKNDLKVFGKSSYAINLGMTKVLKLWRKKTNYC